MIVGEYQGRRDQAFVELKLSGSREEAVRCVIDTGFTGYLMVPRATLARLYAPFLREDEVVLADGSPSMLPVHRVTVDWDGRAREVTAFASDDGEPLIGMKLMKGHRLTMELVSGGDVVMEKAV